MPDGHHDLPGSRSHLQCTSTRARSLLATQRGPAHHRRKKQAVSQGPFAGLEDPYCSRGARACDACIPPPGMCVMELAVMSRQSRCWYRFFCKPCSHWWSYQARIAPTDQCRHSRRRRRTRPRNNGMTSLVRTGRRHHVSVDRGRGCSTRIGPFRTVSPWNAVHTRDATTTGGGYGGYGPPPRQFMPPAFRPEHEMVLSKMHNAVSHASCCFLSRQSCVSSRVHLITDRPLCPRCLL